MSEEPRQTTDPSTSSGQATDDRPFGFAQGGRPTNDNQPFDIAQGSLGASGRRLTLARDSAAVVGGRWSVVDLQIDELVLRGFEHTDRHRVGAAVEHELARLLGERPLPAGIEHAAELARLDGGSIELPAGAPAETLGARIAQAIYQCCTGEVDQ